MRWQKIDVTLHSRSSFFLYITLYRPLQSVSGNVSLARLDLNSIQDEAL